MTREEEINNAAENNTEIECYSNLEENWEDCDITDAFIAGAKWADKNQPSPWIKAEDDLPCNHNELIHRDAENAWTVSCITSDGTWIITNRMVLIDGEWNWGTTNVKYWFAAPELPKE